MTPRSLIRWSVGNSQKLTWLNVRFWPKADVRKCPQKRRSRTTSEYVNTCYSIAKVVFCSWQVLEDAPAWKNNH